MRWAPPLGAGYVWAACKGVGAQRKMRAMEVGTDWWRMAALGWGADVPLFPFVSSEVETPIGRTLGPRGISTSLDANRSEEHTTELQSLMRTPYAVFCLNKKTEINRLDR